MACNTAVTSVRVLESSLLLRMQVFLPDSPGDTVYNVLYDPADDTIRLYDNVGVSRVRQVDASEHQAILRVARHEFKRHKR